MTKIAVISDIHGNLYALESFLEDARKRAVDHVFCLGDSIAIGHESGKLLTVLKNIQNLTIVKGNHERAVLPPTINWSHQKDMLKRESIING